MELQTHRVGSDRYVVCGVASAGQLYMAKVLVQTGEPLTPIWPEPDHGRTNEFLAGVQAREAVKRMWLADNHEYLTTLL